MTAVDDMTACLLVLVEHEQRPPCAHSSDAWMSDDHRQRAAAAHACRDCLLINVCDAYAREIKATHGVWGGRDLTKATRRHR